MSADELLRWGLQESKLRKAEIAEMTTQEDLALVQAACAARRKAVGLSTSEAAHWVHEAQKISRASEAKADA